MAQGLFGGRLAPGDGKGVSGAHMACMELLLSTVPSDQGLGKHGKTTWSLQRSSSTDISDKPIRDEPSQLPVDELD